MSIDIEINYCNFTATMIEDFLMPSEQAIQLIHTSIDILKEKRLAVLDEKDKPLSLRQLAAKSDLDIAALSRAEDKSRIPSFAFFVDWAEHLDTSVEVVLREARARLE